MCGVGLGVDFSDYEVAVNDDESMIELVDADWFTWDRLADKVQASLPVKGSSRGEFLDR